jgi:hypothetical protein
MPALILLFCLAAAPVLAGPNLSDAPIKWFDADNKTIPEPAEIVENQIWDIADHTLFYQVGKALDLGWTARRLGNLLRIAPKRQADNLNRLDEVPNSSWYTNRHFLHPMSLKELAAGPGIAAPVAEGNLEIVAGKFEGGTAGFTVKDSNGSYFLLKFDSEGNNEMGSSAEVIATKILHAAGYYVPRNSVFYFDPARLVIGPKAKVPTPDGGKRPMTQQDMQSILDNIIPQSDGRLRCIASKFLSGKPVGIFDYHGRRKDDPNDQVLHQHRRELRGLRVIGSWMNDADRRAANTLDMYVSEEDGRRYVRHYLIDMGSAFGSNNLMPHLPKYGNEYVWDPGSILRSIVSLGFYRKGWEEPQPMRYPSIGYFENQTFRANKWVPTYPNPAFERLTNRDAYWGAKIVMSFTDEQLKTIIATGRLSDPAAAAELARLVIERRDMIGRHWFAKANPIDRFRFAGDGQAALLFDDLAVQGGLVRRDQVSYRYRHLDASGRAIGDETETDQTRLPLAADGTFQGFEIRSRSPLSPNWSRYARVYIHRDADGTHRVVNIERQE